jgi:hypothetical protein
MNKTTKSVRAPKPVFKIAPVVRLVNPADCSIDQDYVDAIREMLRRAECGESTGLAFVETTNIKGRKGYNTKTIGMLAESPAFCLGTVEVLKANILRRIIG